MVSTRQFATASRDLHLSRSIPWERRAGVEDWAEIRRLRRAEQMPIKQMARVMGCSKNTVKRALASDGPPRYARGSRGSIVDPVEPGIRELLQTWPTMPATVSPRGSTGPGG
jgi:transposase